MATATAARGPLTFLLQSSSGQYLALGLGVYALFPDHVRRALAPFLAGHPWAQLGDWQQQNQQHPYQQQQPIIIQTPPTTVIHSSNGSNSTSKSVTTVLIYSIAGAGACWVGYIVCSQLLPDAVSEFMPVTKRLFQSTSETLGKGILQVKEILQEQIHQLLHQQKALEQNQQETHQVVKDVQGELGEARLDMVNLQSSLDRCEIGLDHSNNMQGYTLRGIQLLVRCVTSFLPDESTFIEDISHYIEEGSSGSSGTAPSLDRRFAPSTMAAAGTTRRHPGGILASRSMSLSSSMPVPPMPPNPNKVFGISHSFDGGSNSKDLELQMEGPSIASMESLDDWSSKEENNSNYMGDIRALLGH